VTTDSENKHLATWSNTGFLDAGTTGLYTFTGWDTSTDASVGFDGLTVDPALSTIYVS